MQFTAVPWMRDHLYEQIGRLSEVIEPTRLLDDGLKGLSEALKGESKGACSTSSARPSSARSWTTSPA